MQKLKNIDKVYNQISKAKSIAFDMAYNKLPIQNSFFPNWSWEKPTDFCEKPKLLWIGASENQDNSGLIEGLEDQFETTIYYRTNGEYGLYRNQDPKIARRVNYEELKKYLKVNNQKFDVIYGQFWGSVVDSDFLKMLKVNTQLLGSLSWDDKLPFLWGKGYDNSTHILSENLDFVALSSPEFLLEYQKKTHAFFLPLGSSKSIFQNTESQPDSSYNHDISFIGNRYGFRVKLIEYLTARGLKVKAYGGDWPLGFADFEKSAKIMRQSKINLGNSFVGHSRKVTTLKLRDFDAPMSGSFYITNYDQAYINMAKTLGFSIDDYHCHSLEDYFNKCVYFLKNHSELEDKAKELTRFTLENFQWSRVFFNLKKQLEKI